MTQTTQSQIEDMKAMCEKLDKTLVKSAHVDDWGRFGNFTVMVVPAEITRSTTIRLKALVRKALPKGAHLRECFPPDPIVELRYGGSKRRVVGYKRNYWAFDIDYQYYDAESNSFSTKS